MGTGSTRSDSIRMNRIASIAIFTTVGLCSLSRTSAAQTRLTPPFSHPIGFSVRSGPDVRAQAGLNTVKHDEGDRSRPGPYFLAGAAVGAVVLGGTAAISASGCADDCMMAGPMILYAAGIGAAIGGLTGLLVYVLRQ